MSPRVVRGGLAFSSPTQTSVEAGCPTAAHTQQRVQNNWSIGSSPSGAEAACVSSQSWSCHVPLARTPTRPNLSFISHLDADNGALDSRTQNAVGSGGESCATVLAGVASAANAACNAPTPYSFASTATTCSGVAATTTVGMGAPEFQGSSTCEHSPAVTTTIRRVVRHYVGGNPSNPQRNEASEPNAAVLPTQGGLKQYEAHACARSSEGFSAILQLGAQVTKIESSHIQQVAPLPYQKITGAKVGLSPSPDHIQHVTHRQFAASSVATAGEALEQTGGKGNSTTTLPWTVTGQQENVQMREDRGAAIACGPEVTATAVNLSPTAQQVDREPFSEMSRNVAGTATSPSISLAGLTSAAKPREIIKYRCPTCDELVSSLDEAVQHCDTSKPISETRTDTCEKAAEQSAASDCLLETPCTANVTKLNSRVAPMLPKGEPVAFDEQGKPSIVRHQDGESGSARTIVKNEDGSHRVFGQNTVASLTSSRFEDAIMWVAALTCHQVRGLVHEIGQRLLESSRLYHDRLAEYEKLGEASHYRFFGLDVGATAKELDNAYRKLAKQMHPDKNGGTEEAKRRFQIMKERYEVLKQKRNETKCNRHEDVSGKPQDLPPSCDKFEEEHTSLPGSFENLDRSGHDGTEDSGQKSFLGIKDDRAGLGDKCENKEGVASTGRPGRVAEQEAAEEGKAARSETNGSIEYDPSDKESMVHTVSKMLKQLKHIEVQMKTLMLELEKARRANTTTCDTSGDLGSSGWMQGERL